MASEEEILLYNEIIASGCCKRCALRYMGYHKTLLTFDYPNTSLVNFGILSPMEEFEIKPIGKKKKANPCSVCLGVLQDSTLEDMLTHENLIRVSEYQHKTFVAYITIPTCVLLRDHSMKLHLKKTFPRFEVQSVIKINHAWRYSVKERLCKILKKQYDYLSKLRLHFYMQYSLEEDEMAVIKDLVIDDYVKYPLSKHYVTTLLDSTPTEQFSKLVSIPPREPFYGVELKDFEYLSETIHIMGNYCKYSRELPVVPIRISEELVTNSIETIILKAIRNVVGDFKEMIFMASSFDYLESRILGRGRTFHLQLTDSKFDELSSEQLKKIEENVRSSKVLEIKNLRQADKKDVTVALDSEQLSPYSFKILCIVYQCKNIDYCVNAVNMHKTIVVWQKTPIRFLTHRALTKKKRTIYYIKAKKVGDNLVEIDFCVQCGFSVPEFVHGECGRTVPSLCDIMKAKVELLATDVVDFLATLPCATEEEEVVI